MSDPPSPALERFLRSVTEPISGPGQLDSFDLRALQALDANEAAQAEAFLIDRMRSEDDWRIPKALVELGSRRAVDPLRQLLERTTSELTRVAAARALHQLAGDDRGASAIVEVLRTSTSWPHRADAARSLRLFRGEAVETALEGALADREGTVAGNALAALLEIHRLQGVASTPYQPLGVMPVRLGSRLPTVAEAAAAELRSIFARLRAAETPAALGLLEQVDESAPFAQRLVSSIRDWDAWPRKLDIELLASMTGWAREWAEHTIIGLLPDDSRAPGALARLGSLRAVRPLRESLGVTMGVARVEVASALWDLVADPACVDAVIEGARSPDRAVRLAAVETLPQFKVAAAEAALRAATADADADVRAAATRPHD